MWARINLIPLLQAEEDRDQVRRYLADQKREKELLGENTKVYHNDRLVNQADTMTPEDAANNCSDSSALRSLYLPPLRNKPKPKPQSASCTYIIGLRLGCWRMGRCAQRCVPSRKCRRFRKIQSINSFVYESYSNMITQTPDLSLT